MDSTTFSLRRWWFGLGLFLIVLPTFLHVSAGPDLWWQLKAGKLFLEQGTLLKTDPFSYVSQGSPWIQHEWLSAVLFAWVHQIGGSGGLFILRCLLLGGVLAGLIRLYRLQTSHPALILAAVFLSWPFVARFINLRAQSFTYLFFILTLILAEKVRKKPGWILWLFPAFLFIWVQLHGGFLLGLLFSTAAMGSLISSNPTRQRVPELFSVLAACWISALLQPFGWDLIRYLVKELGTDHGLIVEWAPLHPRQLSLFLFFFVLPATLAFFTHAWKNREAEFLCFFAVAFLTWQHRRFLILTVILGSLFLLISAHALYESLRPGFPKWPWIRRISLALFMLLLFSQSFHATARALKTEGFGLTAGSHWYPVHAVEFLQKEHLGPQLALTFQWGGYALWKLWPGYLVSADGRNLSVYPSSYIPDYLEAYRDGDLNRWLGTTTPDAAMVETGSPIDYALRQSKGRWNEVYRDKVAVVFSRALPP